MRIGINVAALTTHRTLESSDRAVSRSLERLSTGARINRAADDACGLSLSEGLRSRSAGTRLAVRNSQDAMDLIRTAESGLAATTSVLQRMRDLSVQAANGGVIDDSAKGAIQRELDQLSRQLTRIATTTTYNGTPLLDGSYRGIFQVGAEAGETISVGIGVPGWGVDAASLGVEGIDVHSVADAGVTALGGGSSVRVTPARSAAEGGPTAGSIALLGNFGLATTFTGLAGTITYDGRTLDLATVDYTGATTANEHLREFERAIDDAFGIRRRDVIVEAGQLLITGDVPGRSSTAADGQRLTPTFTAPTTTPATPSSPVSVVDDPLGVIDEAIRWVSTIRAGLGATENRLGHTVSRLTGALDDATAAMSRITDADMATEMTGLTRNMVLAQAGSAVLAQANQTSRAVVRLLT